MSKKILFSILLLTTVFFSLSASNIVYGQLIVFFSLFNTELRS